MIHNFSELNDYLGQFKAGSINDDNVYTLERIKKLMPLIGSPQEKLQVVHIAGTSGKTSTSYYVADMLRAAGAKVGLSISPHVFSISERLQINCVPLDEASMCKLFDEFIRLDGVLELQLTYFELLVAFAFWAFVKQGCTHAVIEVGLGGLIDGTNIVENPEKICVITDIGLDHISVLGNTIAKIAAQKAGIIQPHNHVFCYQQSEEVDTAVNLRSAHMHALVHRFEQPELEKDVKFLKDLPLYQHRNWLLAREVADFVIVRDNLHPVDFRDSQKLIIPARMQRIKVGDKMLVLDGAHNPQKLQALVTSFKKLYPSASVSILASFVESKEITIQHSLDLLHEIADYIIATQFVADADLPHKVIPAKKLAAYCKSAGFKSVIVEEDQKKAFAKLVKHDAQVMLISGSFYLISSLQESYKEYLRG